MLVPPEDSPSSRRFPVRYLAIANAAVLVLGLLVIWGTGMFGSDIDWQGWIAIGLAIVLTSGLGSGLMALAFYSSRSDRDAGVYRVEERGRAQPPDAKEREPGP